MNSSAHFARTVLLLADEAAIRDPFVLLLQQGDYTIVECSDGESAGELAAKAELDLIVVARSQGNRRLEKQIRGLLKNSNLPPVVVFGSPIKEEGREDDRASPVFVTLSRQVSPEDQLRVLEAAEKYGVLVRDNQLVRSEAERVCFDLLRVFGETTEKLNLRTEEVHRIQDILEDTHARILKAFM